MKQLISGLFFVNTIYLNNMSGSVFAVGFDLYSLPWGQIFYSFVIHVVLPLIVFSCSVYGSTFH